MENQTKHDIGEEFAGMRVDRFLVDKTGYSRNKILKQIEKGQVLINEVPVKKGGQKLRCGQTLVWNEPQVVQYEVLAEDIPLDVVYEDSDLIIVNKPAGMVVHPAVGHRTGTLVNALLYHCDDFQGIGGETRPGIVHRIDKDTSGLLIVAKNEQAHHGLSDQFRLHTMDRTYKAFVFGIVSDDSGTITGNIGRHKNDRKKYCVTEDKGKEAITHFKLIGIYNEISLISLKLETGRTHQIRVHMNYIGHPVVGDPVYCHKRRVAHIKDKELNDKLHGIKRQFLHAASLGFIHPVSGEKMFFEVDMPEDMTSLLVWLQSKVESD